MIVALPQAMSESDVRYVLSRENVSGLIIDRSLMDSLGEEAGAVYGYFLPEEYSWRPPMRKSRVFIFLGPRNQISFRMIRDGVRVSGLRWLIYGVPGLWRREHVVLFLARRIWERVIWLINRWRNSVMLALRESRFCRFLNNKYLLRCKRMLAPLDVLMRGISEGQAERRLRKFLGYCQEPLLGQEEFAEKRIVQVNSALAWGGAERQLVNTINGIRGRGYDDVCLLCEHLDLSDDHRFFSDLLHGVKIDSLGGFGVADASDSSRHVMNTLSSAVSTLPLEIAEDVLRYAVYFIKHKPGIVHAWQDSTCIKAGLAALLVGVPRIILAGRNVSPMHFAYYQYYMRPAYQLLGKSDKVTMINNSRAGACDYESWLGLSRIMVVYNGLSDHFIDRADESETRAYRDAHGIPHDAQLVGAIYRLYEEKDPILWVRAIARVAKQRPNVRFLLIGTGPMEGKIRESAEKLGVKDKLLMPGVEKKPYIPLSSMDLFLLTSRFEGTPNVLMEAQAVGVPVVATEAGGVAETIWEGVTGYVVRNRRANTIAQAIISVLDDENLRLNARRNGPDFIRERFGMERMIDETLKLYGMRERSACAESMAEGIPVVNRK